MLYSLTEKLKFDENPVIEVKGKKLTVNADAETVLQLLDILQTRGETQAAIEAFELLFSEKDKKTIKGLKLQFKDYITLLTAAVDLALGEDPDKEEPGEA